MIPKANIGEIAPPLRELLKQKDGYERLIRSTPWSEGSIAITGPYWMAPAGMAASHAFELLLGWPAAFHEATEFAAYSLPGVKPRSLVLAVSVSGEDKAVVDSAGQAARRGATSLALTENVESSLARAARGVFVLPSFRAEQQPIGAPLLSQSALTYIAALAAKVLNPRHPQAQSVEAEFNSLPERLEWLHTHLRDGVRSLASELKGCAQLSLVGGGLYYSAALQGAALARGAIAVEAFHPAYAADEFAADRLGQGNAILLVSGSDSKVKKRLHELAAQMQKSHARLVSITDSNDRNLTDSCNASLVLPPVSEFTGSLLAMALLGWLILEIAGSH